MATNEIHKLNLLARFSQKEFFLYGNSLNRTKLGRFILIAFVIHASVVISQLLVPANSKNPLASSPIKVKYIDIQQPVSLEQKETLIDPKKPKKVYKKKVKPSELLANANNRTRAKKKYPKQKKFRRKKTALQVNRAPNIVQRAEARVKSEKETTRLKRETEKGNTPLSSLEKLAIVPKASKQNTLSDPSVSLGSQGVLSMLDRLNPEKYALQDSKTTRENLDEDEPIPLDTKEAKYVSYFNRIKHQIQRVWTYPAQAVEKNISGQLTLKFEISRDGNLLGLHLVNNSGVEILDMAAIKAVKEAAPYYPFPITIPKKKLSILATFVYNPN